MSGRISQKTITTLTPPARGNRILYDGELPGFGVRITAAGVVSFVLNYRVAGRERRHTIGRWPELSPTAARAEAVVLRGKIRQGLDPQAERERNYREPTVADLAADYLARHARVHKRPSSVRDDEDMLRDFVLPTLGKLKVGRVSRRDIETLHQRLGATPYRANRCLALLSKMFSLAVQWEWRNDNPVAGIPRFPEEKRERWLAPDELARLSAALANQRNQTAANAVRMLLLTGARRGEVLAAQWDELDLDRGVWTKPSAHTKQRRTEHLPLSGAAVTMLLDMKKTATGPHVFPGPRPGQAIQELKSFWRKVCREAGIEGARLHDLRHTHASYLVSSGFSLPLVGALLGHTQPRTTQRYAHVADDPLRRAADRFAAILEEAEREHAVPDEPCSA